MYEQGASCNVKYYLAPRCWSHRTSLGVCSHLTVGRGAQRKFLGHPANNMRNFDTPQHPETWLRRRYCYSFPQPDRGTLLRMYALRVSVVLKNVSVIFLPAARPGHTSTYVCAASECSPKKRHCYIPSRSPNGAHFYVCMRCE